MNPLDQLRDIQLGEQISQWPPAYGWWILLALTVAAITLLTTLLVRRRRRALATRQAIHALSQIDRNAVDWPQRVNQLLKRLALSYYPQTEVATLHGEAWLAFLSQRLPASKRPAFERAMQTFVNNLYQPSINNHHLSEVFKQAEVWAKHCMPAAKVVRGADHV